MKKKDAEIKEVEVKPAQSSEERIAELEAKIREAEEGALSRVCKALGVEPDQVKGAEKPKKQEQLRRMFVRNPVSINGKKYQGDVTVPLSVARVLDQSIGDRRMRLVREQTGNDYILEELGGTGFQPRLVGQVDVTGEKIG